MSDQPPQREEDYRVETEGFFAVAHPTVPWVCPKCDGRGFRMGKTKGRGLPAMVRCECRFITRRHELFNLARVPARFANARLGNFSIEPDPRRLGIAFRAITSFLTDYAAGERRGLVLHGPVGVGKTHLMVGALRKLTLEQGVSCRFADFSHLLAELRLSYDRGGGAQELLDQLAEVEVLLIDEMGKGRQTDWELSILDELVTRRYNANRTCLVTTNFRRQSPRPPEKEGFGRTPNLAREEQYSLEQVVGQRVYSRLCEMCGFVGIEGKDQRRVRGR